MPILPELLGEAMIRFALSQEQVHIVERLVATGRFEAPNSVIGAALALLESRENERLVCLTALHDALALDATAPEAAALQNPANDGAAPAASEDPQPFDADALAEIERLIASRATAIPA